METAKVFWSGRSQAVRLPKEYRFNTDTVRIRRHGSGIILEPIPSDWSWLDELAGELDADFVSALEEIPEQQESQHIEDFFEK